jgi:hypothetical protein
VKHLALILAWIDLMDDVENSVCANWTMCGFFLGESSLCLRPDSPWERNSHLCSVKTVTHHHGGVCNIAKEQEQPFGMRFGAECHLPSEAIVLSEIRMGVDKSRCLRDGKVQHAVGLP